MGLPVTPEAVVQRQLEAYNARSIEDLLATYAMDAQLFEHPATLLAQGHSQLRERFSVRFNEPNLYATLLHRIVLGSFIIDHERVTRTFSEGPGTLEVVMIYEVQSGVIIRSWAVPGAKTLGLRP